MGSRNGTRVNNKLIHQYTLRVGDKIQIGTASVFVFVHHSLAEEKFIEAQKQETVSRLAGGIAHDFNNLIASMLSDIRFLQGLLREPDFAHEQAQECLDNLGNAAMRCNELTKQLLGYAQQGKYENRPLNFSKLVEEALKSIENEIDSVVMLNYCIEPNLHVEGDWTQLYEVVCDLCLAAYDSMPEQGHLLVQVKTVEIAPQQALKMVPLRAGSYVLLTIEDDGESIDPRSLAQIFEPFFTSHEMNRGTGLGLAAVYGIIKNHLGHILVENKSDKGTIFSIYLPSIHEVSQPVEKKTSYQSHIGGLVLLVDDEETVRQDTGNILIQLGYMVEYACDGQEAVAKFIKLKEHIRLVILDMILPKISGKETFRVLKKIDPMVQVLLISGYVSGERVNELIDEGALGFISKPYSYETLKNRINSLFE
jgi:signal transduction histidine kinase/CheY-like chemotaxis protein